MGHIHIVRIWLHQLFRKVHESVYLDYVLVIRGVYNSSFRVNFVSDLYLYFTCFVWHSHQSTLNAKSSCPYPISKSEAKLAATVPYCPGLVTMIFHWIVIPLYSSDRSQACPSYTSTTDSCLVNLYWQVTHDLRRRGIYLVDQGFLSSANESQVSTKVQFAELVLFCASHDSHLLGLLLRIYLDPFLGSCARSAGVARGWELLT